VQCFDPDLRDGDIFSRDRQRLIDHIVQVH